MKVFNIYIKDSNDLLGNLHRISIKKTIIFDYFLVLFLVILSARASFIASNKLFIILFFFFNLFYFIKKKKTFGKFTFLLAYYIFWVILIFIFFNLSIFSFRNIYSYGGFFILILSSFFLVSTVENIFYKIVNIIFILTLISLIFYLFQIIIPDRLFNANSYLYNISNFFIKENADISRYSNSIFFTFDKGHAFRNSGFTWEPGAFGGFLLITLLIYLCTSSFRFGKKFWIFLIASITTFSTTVYIGLLFIFFFIIYNLKDKKKSFLIFIIIIINIILLFSLPFIREKIIEQIIDTIHTIRSSSYQGFLNRFESFSYDLHILKDNLFFIFFGKGIQAETKLEEIFINRPNGIGDYLLTFGFVGFILLIINLYNSFKKITLYSNARGHLIFFIVMIIVLFSNPLAYIPLIFVFQYYYLIKSENDKLVN